MIWFTSDPHYFHKNIIKYENRPFDSVEEMNETMINNWNSVVDPKDTVYLLGDFAFVNKRHELEGIVRKLNGHVHWIRGNHDKIKNVKGFAWEGTYQEVSYDGGSEGKGKWKFVLSHYPFASWNRMHHGSIHCYGHTHGNMPDLSQLIKKYAGVDVRTPELLSFDVGVDCFDFFPVSIDRIVEMAKERMARNEEFFSKKFRSDDHGGDDTI